MAKEYSPNWGGKRPGAGRKQERPYTARPCSMYCTRREQMLLKNCLQLFRAFESKESGEVDWAELGKVSGPSLLDYIHGGADGCQRGARLEMLETFTREQIESLFPSP